MYTFTKIKITKRIVVIKNDYTCIMYVGDKWSSGVSEVCAAEHHPCSQKILVVTKSSVCLSIHPSLHVNGHEMSHLLAWSTKHKKSVFNLIRWTSMLCSIDSCRKRVSAD